MELVRSLNINIKDINTIVNSMEPFEGAREFLDWVRDNFQLTIVSDSFYELAWPLIRKLGTPSINCHYLDVQGDELMGYKLRQNNNKQNVVRALKEMKFTVFASGDSYNDINMLKEADYGVFFQAPEHIKDEFPDIDVVNSHTELKELFISKSQFVERGL